MTLSAEHEAPSANVPQDLSQITARSVEPGPGVRDGLRDTTHPQNDTSGPSIWIEVVASRAMIALQPAWHDLANRALEHNVFLDPAFALPLLQHVRFDRRPEFLLVRETGTGRLVGLQPILFPSETALWPLRTAQSYRHPQITLGTPLLDVERGAEVLETILDWINRRYPHLAALRLVAIPTDGAFHRALRLACAGSGRAVRLFDAHERAILRHGRQGRDNTVTSILSSKRRKERRRQRRRLSEFGVLSYASARTPADVRRAVERFLTLESRGWKGRRGTALLADFSLATFTRTMTRLMAHEGRCRIDSLEIDGIPVAMGILVMAGDQAHFWKTTFDERFASLSPGVLFALDLTEAQEADQSLTMTDSCAIPDHPMIDQLWGDRMRIADVMIELQARVGMRRSLRFSIAVRLETIRRRLRGFAKMLVRTAPKMAMDAVRAIRARGLDGWRRRHRVSSH